MRRSQPRAYTKLVVSSDERADMIDLLQTYGEIPLHSITLLFKSKFGRILDCLRRQIEGGLRSYLQSLLGEIAQFREDTNGNVYISLDLGRMIEESDSKENIQPLLRKRQFDRDTKAFFNPDCVIWRDRLALLDRKKVKVELSFFEQVMMVRKTQCIAEVRRIRTELSKHKNGIEMGKFGYIMPININVFPGRANNEIINNLPELFYTVKRDDQTILYDGFLHTRNDLSGHDDSVFQERTARQIVEDALRSGLYQKTLIIMRDRGLAGLKIHVWLRSIEKNFYQDKKAHERIYEHDSMEFFLALARYGLVEICPGKESRNDLCAFIPRRTSDQVNSIIEDLMKHRSFSVDESILSANQGRYTQFIDHGR